MLIFVFKTQAQDMLSTAPGQAIYPHKLASHVQRQGNLTSIGTAVAKSCCPAQTSACYSLQFSRIYCKTWLTWPDHAVSKSCQAPACPE